MVSEKYLVPRPGYLERIRPFMETDIIKVLTGLRRSGKTTLMRMIGDELLANGADASQIVSVNLEEGDMLDVRTRDALLKAVSDRLPPDGGRAYVFLDEVQHVAGWEEAANALRADSRCDVYVTGSNAHLLAGEMATCITGRYVEFPVYPFSFAEYLSAYRAISPEANEITAFRSYLVTGGMPFLETLRFESGPSLQYLVDLFRAIELKDVVERGSVRDANLLERVLRYALANIGTRFSARSLERYFRNEGRRATVETILSYLRLGREAFMYYPVSRQDVRGKELLTVGAKYYVGVTASARPCSGMEPMSGTSNLSLKTSSASNSCGAGTKCS